MKLRFILSVIILMCLTACQDDLSESVGRSDKSFRLYAGGTSEYVTTRAAANYPFTEGTHFHLFATKAVEKTVNGQTVYDDENWTVNYLSKSGSEKMIEVTSALPDPNLLTGDDLTTVFLANPMNLYGVTIVGRNSDEVADTDSVVEENNKILATLRREKYLNEDNIPHYELKYGGTWSTNLANKNLPDIMSCADTLKGLTPFYNAGNIVMPFRHTLSKLNFYAILGEGMEDKEGTITIKSLSLTDYEGGMLCLRDGLYERGAEYGNAIVDARGYNTNVVTYDADKQPIVKYFDHSGETTPMPQKFCSTLIFPTSGADYKNRFNVVDEESGTEEAPAGHEVKVTLVITVDGVDKEYKDLVLKHYGTPTVFHPNFEYDITFSITTHAVVITLLPKYYDYYEEPINLNESELGEPIDFGGVLWASQNLGATSADPLASPEDWEKARGFYYQHGRSIPYYARGSVLDPYPNVAIWNGKVTSDVSYDYWECETEERWLYKDKNKVGNIHIPCGATSVGYWLQHPHGARVYPYIPSLWEYMIKEKGGNATTGYKAFLESCRMYSEKWPNTAAGNNGNGNLQTKPTIQYSDPHYVSEIFANTAGRGNRMAFSSFYITGGNYLYTRYWHNSKTEKAHRSWYEVIGNPSDPSPKGWRLPTRDEFLSIFPSSVETGDITFNYEKGGPSRRFYEIATGTEDYKNTGAIYVGIYQDGTGYNNLGTYEHGSHTDIEGWGSVYAIKCQGTSEAYAVKWHIETADAGNTEVNPVLDIYEGSKIGRGVLVISKYDLGDDKTVAYLDCEKIEGVADATKPTTQAQYRCRIFRDENGDKDFDTNEKELTDFDWDKPSGVLYLPIPGYIIATSAGGQALIYPGTEALYWSSDSGYAPGHPEYGLFGTAVRIKYAGDHLSRYIYITEEEHLANGCNIRCVRDTKATY